MLTYTPLRIYLESQTAPRLTLTLQEMESILGDHLPPSAYRYPQWWSNSNTNAHPYSRAWTDTGYRTTHVQSTLPHGYITFQK